MGDVSAWVAVGLTALAMLGGCIAYIHALLGGVHTRISSARDYAEEKVKEAKEELKGDVANEREERRRENDRIEKAMESFGTAANAVTALLEGVKHLGERLDDNRRSTDRALDEIKHSMRNMDTKIQAISTRKEDNAR